MISLRGKAGNVKYLMVKDRVVLLRMIAPEAQVISECLSDGQIGENNGVPIYRATFKTTVALPDGTVGDGHGSETSNDFPDYYEKAATKSLGRAIYAAGIGLQFPTPDFEYEQDEHNTKSFNGVDTPVSINSRKLTPVTREELLVACNAEKARLTPAVLGDYAATNFQKTRMADLTDAELGELLTWCKTQ